MSYQLTSDQSGGLSEHLPSSKYVELVSVGDHGMAVPPGKRGAAAPPAPEDMLTPNPIPCSRPKVVAKQIRARRHFGRPMPSAEVAAR